MRISLSSTFRSSRNHRNERLRERRQVLKTVLQEQIRIANVLSDTEGRQSDAARWAWDVVEEVSRKLNRVEDTIAHTHYGSDQEDRMYMSMYHEDELGRREYDI